MDGISRALREISRLQPETIIAMQAIKSCTSIGALDQITESSAMKAIRGMRGMSAAWELSRLDNSASDQLRRFSHQDYFADLLSGIQGLPIEQIQQLVGGQKISDAILSLGKSELIEQIARINNSPFDPHVLELARVGALTIANLAKDDVRDDSELEEYVDADVLSDIKATNDYTKLSPETKKILSYLYHTYIVPLLIALLVLAVSNNAGIFQAKLDCANSPAEVRKLARNPGEGVDRVLLRGYRVVTGSNVNVRVKPNIKSAIVERLQLGQLIEILDRTNRSWLYIQVDIEDEVIEGWISRQHTAALR